MSTETIPRAVILFPAFIALVLSNPENTVPFDFFTDTLRIPHHLCGD
jgi:hypothetical protein